MLADGEPHGATADDHERISEPHTERAAAAARDADDGLRLLPHSVGRGTEAADLSDLDLRLCHSAAGQGFLRSHRWPAAAATGRAAGPGLLALQQPQFRDPRGPAGRLGRRRALGRVRQRHGRHRHRHAGDPAPRRHAPAQPPALRRHRDADPQPAHGVRHHAGGLHRRLRSRPDRRRCRGGHGQGAGGPDHAGNPGQPDQRAGRPRRRRRHRRRGSARARAAARRSPSTTRCSGRCTSTRCGTAPTSPSTR